jgi:hypothetical protein
VTLIINLRQDVRLVKRQVPAELFDLFDRQRAIVFVLLALL